MRCILMGMYMRTWRKMKVENDLIVNLEGLLKEFGKRCSSDFNSSVCKMLDTLKESESVKTGPIKYSWGIASGTGLLSKYVDDHFDNCLSICDKIGLNIDSDTERPSQVLSSEKKVKGWGFRVAELSHSAWVVKELEIASNLELMRLITLILRDFLYKTKVTYCALCFRVTRTRKYCWHHSSDSPDFHRSKKIGGVLKRDKEVEKYIRKRELREVYGENPVGNSRELSYLLENSIWEDSSLALIQMLRAHLPTIFLLLGEKLKAPNGLLTYKFLKEKYRSLSELITEVYSKNVLDNRWEKSRSVFWFLNTLVIANGWYKAELDMQASRAKQRHNTLMRNEQVFSLHKQGFSVREIAEQIGVGKSLIQKLLTTEKR